MVDRLALWWLGRRGYFATLPNAAAALHVELQGRARARRWPRWGRYVLQGVLVLVVGLGSIGYCYRYSLLGIAPGP